MEDKLKKAFEEIPDWVKRLNNLSDKINSRQAELAVADVPSPTALNTTVDRVAVTQSISASSLNHLPVTSSTSPNPTQDTTTATHSGSQAGAVTKSRLQTTTNKRTTYYDGDVQSVFEHLIKYINNIGYLLRKAKKAEEAKSGSPRIYSRPDGIPNHSKADNVDLLKGVETACEAAAFGCLRGSTSKKDIQIIRDGFCRLWLAARKATNLGNFAAAVLTRFRHNSTVRQYCELEIHYRPT